MTKNYYTPAVKRATDKYKREKQEQLNMRIPMGYKMGFNELAKKRGKALSGMIIEWLCDECEKEGIELVRMTKEELEAKKRDGN